MINYTDEQGNEVYRKTLTPSILSSYLPSNYNSGNGYTTPTLTSGQPTKLLIPTTVKKVKDWMLDVPNSRWFLNNANASNRDFFISMTTSLTASVGNNETSIMMYKNGILEEGVNIDRKIGVGSDKGAMSISGTFSASHNDYIEVYVVSEGGGTLTFYKTTIVILEIN